MNEFERRSVEVVQTHMDLLALVKAMGKRAIVEYFGYTAQLGTEAAPLVNGVRRQAVIAIQSDAYFVLQYISTCVRPDLNANPRGSMLFDSGNIMLQITDTGAGEILYSQEAPAGILTGTVDPGVSGIPILLPIPRVIPPNTNIKIEMTQVGVSVPNPQVLGAFVSLMGARIVEV